MALGDGLVERLCGAGAGLADENDRPAARQFAGIEGREGLIDRAWNMPGHEFMRLAHIHDGDRTIALACDEIVMGDLGRRGRT